VRCAFCKDWAWYRGILVRHEIHVRFALRGENPESRPSRTGGVGLPGQRLCARIRSNVPP